MTRIVRPGSKFGSILRSVVKLERVHKSFRALCCWINLHEEKGRADSELTLMYFSRVTLWVGHCVRDSCNEHVYTPPPPTRRCRPNLECGTQRCSPGDTFLLVYRQRFIQGNPTIVWIIAPSVKNQQWWRRHNQMTKGRALRSVRRSHGRWRVRSPSLVILQFSYIFYTFLNIQITTILQPE